MEITKYLKYIIPLVLLSIFLIVSILLGIFYASKNDTIWIWANSVTLFGIGFASSISLYGLLNANEQFNKQIIHSNNQLEDQLTKKSKEEAIFTVKQVMDNSILNNDSKSTIVSLPNILYDELKKEGSDLNAIFNSNDRSRFFSYFKKISRNDPMIFYYLNNKTQEKIHRYINKYDDIIFDIRDIVYCCEIPIDKNITKIESKLDIDEILDIKKSSIDMNKKSKLYISIHRDDYPGPGFYYKWNFILKEFYYETIYSRKSEIVDVAANIHQNIIDELNQILKDIFLEIDKEYKRFGYPE